MERSSTEHHGAARVTRVSLWNIVENSRVAGTRDADIVWSVVENSRVSSTFDAGVMVERCGKLA